MRSVEFYDSALFCLCVLQLLFLLSFPELGEALKLRSIDVSESHAVTSDWLSLAVEKTCSDVRPPKAWKLTKRAAFNTTLTDTCV